MTLLCTIGYEGFGPSTWMSTLLEHGVEAVIDVRDVPLSRKAGFSKSQLARSLEAAGIEYVHVRALGNPRVYRDALREGLDFGTFSGMFASLLDDRDEILREILDRAADQRLWARHLVVVLVWYRQAMPRCEGWARVQQRGGSVVDRKGVSKGSRWQKGLAALRKVLLRNLGSL